MHTECTQNARSAGKWIIVTIGFHILLWDNGDKQYVHRFHPLVCLFCLNHESTESIKMARDALDLIAVKFFGKKLREAVTVLDHSNGLMEGMRQSRPSHKFLTCWPHLARKYKEGTMLAKSHPHFEDVYTMLRAVHLAHTLQMKELLETIIFEIWEQWEARGEERGRYTTRQLWNEYFLPPWVRSECSKVASKCIWNA